MQGWEVCAVRMPNPSCCVQMMPIHHPTVDGLPASALPGNCIEAACAWSVLVCDRRSHAHFSLSEMGAGGHFKELEATL